MPDNNTIRKITRGGVVTTLAGSAGQSGSADGTGSAARFTVRAWRWTAQGNVYVADTDNYTIRKVTPTGVVTTLAGSAGQPGQHGWHRRRGAVLLSLAWRWTVAGNVYVADTGNNTIRKVTGDGVVTTLAGSAGQSGSADGTGSAARFNYPYGVAVDSAGNVYVADTCNYTIRKVTRDGVVTTLAGSAGTVSGSADGTGSAAQFNYPSGVAVDSAGNVYVADSGNNTIRRVTSSGVVTTLAGSAELRQRGWHGRRGAVQPPCGVAVDGAGNVFVADTGNSTIRRMASGGRVTTIGGEPGIIGGANGIGCSANFAEPSGIAVDGSGRVYVADAGNNRISTGTPLPAMNIAISATRVIVSWPASYPEFVLQQNADIGNTSGWSTARYRIKDDGTNKSITLLLPMGDQFFRLMAN